MCVCVCDGGVSVKEIYRDRVCGYVYVSVFVLISYEITTPKHYK